MQPSRTMHRLVCLWQDSFTCSLLWVLWIQLSCTMHCLVCLWQDSVVCSCLVPYTAWYVCGKTAILSVYYRYKLWIQPSCPCTTAWYTCGKTALLTVYSYLSIPVDCEYSCLVPWTVAWYACDKKTILAAYCTSVHLSTVNMVVLYHALPGCPVFSALLKDGQ